MRKFLIIVASVAVASPSFATLYFNSATPANNAATRASFLAAAGVGSGQFFEDFESYALNTDMNGASLAGGLVMNNTGTGLMDIRGGTSFGGSTAIDAQAVW